MLVVHRGLKAEKPQTGGGGVEYKLKVCYPSFMFIYVESSQSHEN